LFELLLPPGMRVLSGELAEVDRLLDDGRFFGPFRRYFDPSEGRPSIPIETYLRLMFLKYRYQLGYERVCVLVGDSITWRRFCRIGLEVSVPDESTIRKITRRCGPELIDALKRELLSAAHHQGHVGLTPTARAAIYRVRSLDSRGCPLLRNVGLIGQCLRSAAAIARFVVVN
jgi:IS5 family transposase